MPQDSILSHASRWGHISTAGCSKYNRSVCWNRLSVSRSYSSSRDLSLQIVLNGVNSLYVQNDSGIKNYVPRYGNVDSMCGWETEVRPHPERPSFISTATVPSFFQLFDMEPRGSNYWSKLRELVLGSTPKGLEAQNCGKEYWVSAWAVPLLFQLPSPFTSALS